MRLTTEEGPKKEEMDNSAEQNKEQKVENIELKIYTVADFLQSLEWARDREEGGEKRSLISRQIEKINTGLAAINMGADEIYVQQMPDGVLGMYNPDNNRIAAAESLLSDFNNNSTLLKVVFVHEMIHKEGIHDEGLTQYETNKRVSGAPSGIYSQEQQQARKTFNNIGMDEAISIYDLINPKELADFYLEAEVEKKYKERGGNLSEAEEEEILADRFKKGAPRLYEKLRERNYSFKNKIRQLISDLKMKERKN